MAVHPPIVLCKSVHHGNTAWVASEFAAVLGAAVAAPEEVPSARLDGVTLVGFGSGISYGRMHHALSGWLTRLPDAPALVTPAFLFSTSGLPWLSWLWHRPLRFEVS